MASIYTHKESNIKRTWLMFSVFFIVVIGIGWAFSYIYNDQVILYFAVGFSSFMSILSYWHSDKIVLKMSHAVPVQMSNHPELYRIVENLSITAGLPMPKVYVSPEASANAFATGRNPEHSAVVVTEGLLAKLDRTELEGVIAHELSHIGNRDMLVGTVAVILVGFISLLSDIFMRSMFWGRRRSSDSGGAGAWLMIIGLALAILAPIAATLIRLAISRRRESLADASGVLLTRYPEGLAKALEKIEKDVTPMRFANNTTSHLWLEDPFHDQKKVPLFHKLFMSHPPTGDRVRVLREMSV